jgi:hypothetical protein
MTSHLCITWQTTRSVGRKKRCLWQRYTILCGASSEAVRFSQRQEHGVYRLGTGTSKFRYFKSLSAEWVQSLWVLNKLYITNTNTKKTPVRR